MALSILGLEKIGVYIIHRKNMVAQYILTQPIMYLCLVAEQKLGIHLSRRWWEQPALNIMGIRAGQVAIEGREETGGG